MDCSPRPKKNIQNCLPLLPPPTTNNSTSADIQNSFIIIPQELSFSHLHNVIGHFSGKDNIWKHHDIKGFVIWRFTNRAVLTYLDFFQNHVVFSNSRNFLNYIATDEDFTNEQKFIVLLVSVANGKINQEMDCTPIVI